MSLQGGTWGQDPWPWDGCRVECGGYSLDFHVVIVNINVSRDVISHYTSNLL